MADTADIDAQITALEAMRNARIAHAAEKERHARREKQNVLVDVTPTKKNKASVEAPPSPPKQPALTSAAPSSFTSAKNPSRKKTTTLAGPTTASFSAPPRASSLAANFAKRRAEPAARSELPTLERSSGFGERKAGLAGPSWGGAVPSASSCASASVSNAVADLSGSKATPATKATDTRTALPSTNSNYGELEIVRDGRERAGDLTLLNDLAIGPREFGPDPEGGEEWRSVEPNSGIRLSKRVLPHADLQDHLYGRYHLSPQQIYSVVRLSRDGSTYDVPVEGDWVTIAVVAERSDIRVSGMRDVVSDEEDDDDGKGRTARSKRTFGDGQKGKEKEGNKRHKRQPRKYINLKLVSLPPRHKTLSGGMSLAGDALLQLLLFEADSVVRVDDGQGGQKKSYHGGSGGAYERWCNLGVGSVVAVLNPRILRPLKAGGASPHPLTLPLALNPQSDASIQLIGQAMDLGQCEALQRDGNRCKTYVDKRVGTVCEYHVHASIKRTRSSRAELASASTSFELQIRSKAFGGSAAGGGKGDQYDPRLKRGLLPRESARAAPRGLDNGGGGATYVVGSGIARTGNSGPSAIGDQHLAERMGRSQAERHKRKMEAAETETALAKLIERTGDTSVGARYLTALGKRSAQPTEASEPRKRVFHAEAIKRIGFDPTGRRYDNPEKRSAALESLKAASNRPFSLGHPPGPRKLSSVVAPSPAAVPLEPSARPVPPTWTEEDGERWIDLSEVVD